DSHGKLHLPRCIGIGSLQEIGRLLIGSRKIAVAYPFVELHELLGSVDEGVIRDVDSPIVAIEHIEELGDQFQFKAAANKEPPSDAHVGSCVIGTEKCISSISWKPVIHVVQIAVGIAEDTRI